MVWIRIGAGFGRSSSGIWLFASLSVECKTVGNGIGADPHRSWSGAGLFSQTQKFATGSQRVN